MVSIHRTVPKKAYIHSEGRKDLASFLAFLKVSQRIHKGEKKRRRKKPKNKFKKKKEEKRKEKTAKDEENPTFPIGEKTWTKRLAVGVQNDLQAKNGKYV